MKTAALLALLAAASVAAAPPNVLFVLADDLGWTDLGCYGSSFYETPNLDGLAAAGMRFTQAYAACPVCSPTRASILAGKYPARMQTTDYFGAPPPERWTRPTKLLPAPYRDRLPLTETTLAEALKANGYATFFAGKWHLGSRGFWPEDQGFDVNMGGCESGGPYGPGRYFVPYGNPRLPDGPKGEHLPDRLATETVKFMEERRGGPFLAYLSFYDVHVPLMAREDLKAKYVEKKSRLGLVPRWGREGATRVRQVQENAVYAGMIDAMDQAVGKVLAAVDRLGLASNTIVFFMSDNGGAATPDADATSNLPLRAGKGWLYEGGIREPLLVRWPGRIAPGSTCDAPVISTDFYPTILELAGLPGLPEQTVDGVSFAPLLRGEARPRGPLFWHYPHYGNQGGAPGGAVREGDWKLIEWYDGRTELFDIARDMGERNNLAARHPEKAGELLALLRTWREETGARMPTPNPAFKP